MNRRQEQVLGGRYDIVKELGCGAFGQTYLSKDINLPDDPYCVVKRFAFQSSDSSYMATAKRLFENEAKVLQNLPKHNQVPQILAYLEENNQLYLVQEYIEGDDLSKELILGKQMEEHEVIELLRQILQAVDFIQQNCIIHRDIKPSNLVRRKSDGQIVLIDFGAVKEFGHTQMSKGRTISIGSVGYMAPEQMGGYPKPSSDIYAVGMVGILALTGQEPEHLSRNSQQELIWRDQNMSVSNELATILDKMVRYDCNERYSSAKDVLRDLEGINGKTIRVVTPPKSTIILPRSYKKILWVGLCSFFLVSLVSLVFAYVSFSRRISATDTKQEETSDSTTTQNNQNMTVEDKNLLDEAQIIAAKATEIKKNAGQKISELNKAKAQWQQAVDKLEGISFSTKEVKEKKDKYQKEIMLIENEIKNIRKICPDGDGVGKIGMCLP